MNVTLTISCRNCGKSVSTYITPNNKNYYLSYSIESESKDFECNTNDDESMKVSCSCGNEINICL